MTDRMNETFGGVFEGLPVLVTGHTGFKGSWLSIWLNELGANVIGHSLEPQTTPSNFQLSQLASQMIDVRGDVRDVETLRHTIERYQPRAVFHLAAQPIVLESYRAPKETFDVNVGGTVNVLEAIRATRSVEALVHVASDKCYENQEWIWGYRENDMLGGHDPYSTSKAMAELCIASYRRSFFADDSVGGRRVAIASARAGNVIGGGDWASHRLIPDCIRALMTGDEIHLRNPTHTRPWQHVFESLSGYLLLAAKLLHDSDDGFSEAWNFGPPQFQAITTEEIVKKIIELWGGGSYSTDLSQSEAETRLLSLNWDKAANRLNWRPVYSAEEALAATVAWYRSYRAQVTSSQSVDMYSVCKGQISEYTESARRLGVEWAVDDP